MQRNDFFLPDSTPTTSFLCACPNISCSARGLKVDVRDSNFSCINRNLGCSNSFAPECVANLSLNTQCCYDCPFMICCCPNQECPSKIEKISVATSGILCQNALHGCGSKLSTSCDTLVCDNCLYVDMPQHMESVDACTEVSKKLSGAHSGKQISIESVGASTNDWKEGTAHEFVSCGTFCCAVCCF